MGSTAPDVEIKEASVETVPTPQGIVSGNTFVAKEGMDYKPLGLTDIVVGGIPIKFKKTSPPSCNSTVSN